jgi:hypothetical protein
VAFHPISSERLHACTVKRIGTSNARTNRDGVAILNNRYEGLSVWDVGQPIFEASPKKVGIVGTNRHGRRARQPIRIERIGRPRPDTLNGSVGGKEVKILIILSR